MSTRKKKKPIVIDWPGSKKSLEEWLGERLYNGRMDIAGVAEDGSLICAVTERWLDE